ncbi:MAG: flagellar biosynthesis protein FlhF [Firmicutes bacterium]|nr:flagellar biosynthesis protein FlhF [Bacillota bacterium]
MRVKKFTGKTIQEAVENLRDEFGPDAVILHTTQKRAWLWGRLGPKRYEVLGAFDLSYQASRGKNRRPAGTRTATQPYAPSTAPYSLKGGQASTPADGRLDPAWSEAVQSIYSRLIKVDIPRDLAAQLIREVLGQAAKEEWNNEAKLWAELTKLIASRIKTALPWEFDAEQKVVVLIGPTGVGKTTTIAKLAANFSLVAGRKVGLITVDTYRIAAVEQLKTYAEIIGLPLHVAYSPKELKEGIAKLKDRDLILIDTAGRSQNNHIQIAELRNFFEGVEAEMHLVISATTKPRDVDEIISVFGQLPIDRVIITKLDETSVYGVLLHTCERAQVPIAFVTTGQGVPEDIEVADGERIAQLILGDA